MKIEKVNDNQIRCTLTKEDLASRHLKISELAYGSEKAKSLFRDMMQQANYEFGFEAEDMPLMIEAIPMNAECLVLVITKVEDPEELDTRFARFAPSVQDEMGENDEEEESEKETSDEIMDLFQKIQKQGAKLSGDVPPGMKNLKETAENLRLFCFLELSALLSAAKTAGKINVTNNLYKDDKNNRYLLFMEGTESTESFAKLSNHLSEYAALLPVSSSTPAYLTEHCSLMLSENALTKLAEI